MVLLTWTGCLLHHCLHWRSPVAVVAVPEMAERSEPVIANPIVRDHSTTSTDYEHESSSKPWANDGSPKSPPQKGSMSSLADNDVKQEFSIKRQLGKESPKPQKPQCSAKRIPGS